MKELRTILNDVSKGKLEAKKAEKMIEALFKAVEAGGSAGSEPRKRFGAVLFNGMFEGLSGQVSVRKIVEKSREYVQGADRRLTPAGFQSHLSLLSHLDVSEDCRQSSNSVSGSQWKQVEFLQECDIRDNKFTVTQLSDFLCSRSDFSKNQFGLAKLSDVTVCESRFEGNRISRTLCCDMSLTESDFTANRLLSCEVRGLAVNGSRLSGLTLLSSQLTECEFDQSDIQGIRFEDCTFDECSFVNCEIVSDDYQVIRGMRAKGVRLNGLHSAAELVAALESPERASHNARRSSGGSRDRRKK
ncbi:MAG: hypothetical protein RJB13_552 [Pseudomonadota bacterium]|jgi:uncharacterized protein YjbI with pentapeptide repeats